jgi:mRNA interferase RelE/StbE
MGSAFRIDTTPTFERDFESLDPSVARRVSRKIIHLASHPEEIGHPLKNMPSDLAGLRKYRIGDYRLLYWVDHSQRVIKLYAVQHRSIIYRDL